MTGRIILITLILAFGLSDVRAQELFPFSEPASNMPTKSIGVRVTNEATFNNGMQYRLMPEIMFGFNKNLMGHFQTFISDIGQSFNFEGASMYAKYRFLSNDHQQAHFRMAGYARISYSNREFMSKDLNLEGDNSGWQAGVVATQLIHKLAISGGISYNRPFESKTWVIAPEPAINYNLSSGLLLLPVTYKSYSQPNFNVYLEILGKTALASGNTYLDLAPTAQVIVNSVTRLDLGYRFQLTGDMKNRYSKNMVLARVEFNFFNALK